MFEDNPFQTNFKREDIEKTKKIVRRFVPVILIIVILGVVAYNSIYILNSGEEAVITRFGRWIVTEKVAGLKFKIPFVDNAHIVNVSGVRRMDFGSKQDDRGDWVSIQAEALMLTGEGRVSEEGEVRESQVNGLVNADWVIQYRISNSYNYLFKVENPEATLHSVTQAAYRRVAAAYPLDAILTDQKDVIQHEIMQELQSILNLYEMGIQITAVQLQDASPPDQVRDAFLDVTKSQEDRIARTNEAERYRNEELPRAHGRAAQVLNEAEGYRAQRVNEAEGSVSRYRAIEEEYRNQPDIMRTRLYLEMIREVMPRVEKVYFIDQTSGGLLEILHLGQ